MSNSSIGKYTWTVTDYKPDLNGEEGLTWRKHIEMSSKRPGLLVHSWYVVHGGSGQWRIDQWYFETTDYKRVLYLPCWSWFGMNLLPVRHLRARHRTPTIHGKRFQGWMCELSTSSDKDSSLWAQLKCKRNKATIEHTNINILGDMTCFKALNC